MVELFFVLDYLGGVLIEPSENGGVVCLWLIVVLLLCGLESQDTYWCEDGGAVLLRECF